MMEVKLTFKMSNSVERCYTITIGLSCFSIPVLIDIASLFHPAMFLSDPNYYYSTCRYQRSPFSIHACLIRIFTLVKNYACKDLSAAQENVAYFTFQLHKIVKTVLITIYLNIS